MKGNNLLNSGKIVTEKYRTEYKNGNSDVWAYIRHTTEEDSDGKSVVCNYTIVTNLNDFKITNNVYLGKKSKILLSNVQIAIELKLLEDELKSIKVYDLNSAIKNLKELDHLKVTDILNKADELFKHDFIIYGENIEMTIEDYPIFYYPLDRVDQCFEIIAVSGMLTNLKGLHLHVDTNKCMFLPNCYEGEEE